MREFPRNYDQWYGIEPEMAELRASERRKKELQQRIREKTFQKRFETEVETMYYEYRRDAREARPPHLSNLSEEERHQHVGEALYLKQKPLQEISGETGWEKGPVFRTRGYDLRQQQGQDINLRVKSLLEDIVAYYYCTGGAATLGFTIRNHGNCQNFYLVWSKGDGVRYTIFDLEHYPEPEILQSIEQLKYLSTWAYGSLQVAYKTKSNLAVVRFYLKAD